MNQLKEDIEKSLETINKTKQTTKKAIQRNRAWKASFFPITWGVIWLLGLIAAYFFQDYRIILFISLYVTALILTITWLWLESPSKQKIKSASFGKVFWRIFWFWFLLNPFIIIWLLLLAPFTAFQAFAFFCTICMFGICVMGLWFGRPFLVFSGLLATIVITLNYFFSPTLFFLLTSISGGSILLISGIYILIRSSKSKE
ncbi:MAG: hypothetical protein ACYS67_15330 [Planctomycetota bacterium]|jgi:hypothetical protein